jgi:hypothetical protein
MSPQLVTKVNVVGKVFATVLGCNTEGDVCGLAVALLQIFTGSLVAAETAGARDTDRRIADAITKVRFMMAK